jgi:hypothetical protein
MDRSLLESGRGHNSNIPGCAELAIEDQRAIGGGWTWVESLVVGAALAATMLAAPELLVGAAVVGAYEVLK